MAKPSSLPRWADTVTGDTSRVVNPPNAKKDVGWAVGERPAAQYMNWLLNNVYDWLKWLDDNIGTDIAATAWHWTADHQWDGDALWNTPAADWTVYPDATFKGDVSTDETYHFGGSRYRVIGCADGYEVGSAGDWVGELGGVKATVGNPGGWVIPIPVDDGFKISVSVRVKHSTATGSSITATVYRQDGDASTQNVVGSGANSAASSATQTINVITNHNVVAGNQYMLAIGGTADVMDRYLYDVTVTYSRP
jgi:hypothetical protein